MVRVAFITLVVPYTNPLAITFEVIRHTRAIQIRLLLLLLLL